MSRRIRRSAAATGTALLLLSLAACGGSDGSDGKAEDSTSPSASSSSGSDTADSAGSTGELAEVSFEGDVGKALTPTWNEVVEVPTETTTTTLVEGDGDKIASGDTVSVYLWIGDGTTQKEVYSDYTNGAPESLPNDGQLGAVFDALFKDATYGSRVAAVTTPEELLGASASSNQLGIDVKDSLVVVADIVEKAAVSPTPTDDKVHESTAGKQPKVVEKNGKPTGLDWTGVAEPALDTPVQRLVLKQGSGAVVKASDTVTVNYLGETYQAKTPFDESYSKTPLTSALSGLVQGWSIGLTGVKVGSRVLLQMPPAYGYGAQGSGAIPANATLWFVIDVVKVGS